MRRTQESISEFGTNQKHVYSMNFAGLLAYILMTLYERHLRNNDNRAIENHVRSQENKLKR